MESEMTLARVAPNELEDGMTYLIRIRSSGSAIQRWAIGEAAPVLGRLRVMSDGCAYSPELMAEVYLLP